MLNFFFFTLLVPSLLLLLFRVPLFLFFALFYFYTSFCLDDLPLLLFLRLFLSFVVSGWFSGFWDLGILVSKLGELFRLSKICIQAPPIHLSPTSRGYPAFSG